MKLRVKYRKKNGKQLSSMEQKEILHWRSLAELPPEEWVRRVDALPVKARPQIARMIWWDFWSERTVAERWPHFDAYLQFDHDEDQNPLPRSTVASCLKTVGYPKYRIKLRLISS
jgi:hypothetical protein